MLTASLKSTALIGALTTHSHHLKPPFKERLKDPTYVSYLVNVWHGNSHKPECADEHSLRNTPMKGMVTGEEIESGWAKMNRKQYTTREMDAGARRDSITVHMINHNKDKLKRMGKQTTLKFV